MQEVFRAIGRLSQSNVTVLITGESGTGKELVARALHKHSPRAAQPFIALNTAAIPKDLLESELFGHERGAFTGAQATRRGRFEQAENGTLFLDEIGDMPFDLQTRLLRVLSDGHFYRVGGHQPMKANVRVIAATHQNLEQRVREGLFREDLYHRLNVIRLRLPSLRERREDIPILTRHFLVQSARQLGVEAKRMSRACDAVSDRAGFAGQRAATGKPVQLDHRDGAGANGRSQGFAAGTGGRARRCDRVFGLAAWHLRAAARCVRQRCASQRRVGAGDAAAGTVSAPAGSACWSWRRRSCWRRAAGSDGVLGRQFESVLIKTALKHTHGRKNDAAVRLGHRPQHHHAQDPGTRHRRRQRRLILSILWGV